MENEKLSVEKMENKPECEQTRQRKQSVKENENEEAPDHTESNDTRAAWESASAKRKRLSAQRESMSKEEKEKKCENEGR